MPERILTQRELNRATLARQLLLERASLTPLAAIKQLIALQGQVSNAPYIGLWTRLRSFQRTVLTSLLENRQVVRAPSLRGTLHIITAEDYMLLHPVIQHALSANLHTFARQTAGFDMTHFISEMHTYIQEQPRTANELRAKMEELYPSMRQQRILDSVRMYMALIHILPAGTWGFTGKPVYIEATTWLGLPLTISAEGPQQLILRYLAAFGPASVKDIQKWSGLARVQQTIEKVRSELLTFRDEQGRELFDLPYAPRPDANTPAPVRFLPEYDNLLFSYAEHGRIISSADVASVFSTTGSRPKPSTFLVDGFVRGMWRIECTASPTLVIEPFGPLSHEVQNALQEEGERLMNWVLDDITPFHIEFSKTDLHRGQE